MKGYNPKSCNEGEKIFYTPIEAAIRWCNLLEQENVIISALALNNSHIPILGQFTQWPCLRNNSLKIIDAIEHGNLPYGRDGKLVPSGEQVARARLTIRHIDLKKWMTLNYPDQKPAFLFDEIERKTHSAFNMESFQSLQADRDAINANLKKKTELFNKLQNSYNALQGERDSLRAMVEQKEPPLERAETTYLNVIGSLLALLLGKSPQGNPYSSFETEAAIISAMLAYHHHKQGISARTLQGKFAEAKRSLDSE